MGCQNAKSKKKEEQKQEQKQEVGQITEISSLQQLLDLISSQRALIIEFFSVSSQPSKQISDSITQQFTKGQGYSVAKVNTDQTSLQEVQNHFKVKGVPHVILYIQQNKVDEFDGQNQNKLQEFFLACQQP